MLRSPMMGVLFGALVAAVQGGGDDGVLLVCGFALCCAADKVIGG